jgi:hypothetical protein
VLELLLTTTASHSVGMLGMEDGKGTDGIVKALLFYFLFNDARTG